MATSPWSTSDLLALSSDAYDITEDSRMVLKESREGVPPTVKLDDCFKFVDQLNNLVENGPPSLINCTKLTVEGKVKFGSGTVIEGTVKFVNKSDSWVVAPGKTYKDQTVEL